MKGYPRHPTLLALTAAAILLLPLAGARAVGEEGPRLPDGALDTIRSFANAFIEQQNPNDGGYYITSNVQTHLKAEIAMALASDVLGSFPYAESARRDLDWVVANRLEPNGGLSWSGPQSEYFFEVHQHWFLIASELIRQLSDRWNDLKWTQCEVWQFLVRTNQAHADFYEDNLANHGTFFAYRSVDRSARFQTQAPFKGSYEIGAALWSLALHRGSTWLNSQVGHDQEQGPESYLVRMIPQILQLPDDHGFYDPAKGLWVRSVLWNSMDWSGWETHDWKYALHMQEGALLYSLLTGRTELLGPASKEMDELLPRIAPDGSIRGIPDGYGVAAYEYGEALSCLGLGARAFYERQPLYASRCLQAGQRVFDYAVRTFEPRSSEDRAMLLAGICRVVLAMKPRMEFALDPRDSTNVRSSPLSLSIWPNPMSYHADFFYSIPSSATASLRIVDIAGRERAWIPIEAVQGVTGLVGWDGLDATRQRLPSGRYTAILDSQGNRQVIGLTILH